MLRFFEQIHDRLADEAVRRDDAEQLEPGRIGVDDDAFLHLDDRVVRAFENGFELPARIARRLECGFERAFQAERTQLASHHRLQAGGACKRDDIAGTARHGNGDAAFIEAFRHDDDRHGRGELIAHAGRAGEIVCTGIDEQQQLGIQLPERVAKISQGRDPGAMDRMTRPSQDAVDLLDRIAGRAQNDERDCVLLDQRELHHTGLDNQRRILARAGPYALAVSLTLGTGAA